MNFKRGKKTQSFNRVGMNGPEILQNSSREESEPMPEITTVGAPIKESLLKYIQSCAKEMNLQKLEV